MEQITFVVLSYTLAAVIGPVPSTSQHVDEVDAVDEHYFDDVELDEDDFDFNDVEGSRRRLIAGGKMKYMLSFYQLFPIVF